MMAGQPTSSSHSSNNRDVESQMEAGTAAVDKRLVEDSSSSSTGCLLYDVAIGSHQVPIIYRPEYNITLFGLERLHPFDAGKWGRVVQFLKEQKLLVDSALVQPREATKKELLRVHKQSYLNSLKWSVNVARITEVAPAALLPNCLLQRKLLRPFRYQTGGSVLAGRCAVERGWSINVGGGFHHCSGKRGGGGFCAYADISLTIQVLLEHYEHIKKVLILDLDAHQGNGHERDFMGREDVYIMDVYNRLIYPRDEHAKKAISKRIELSPYTENPRYLQAVEQGLEESLQEFAADIVIYNAGTDILEGDPLGLLSITKQGIIKRDELVWEMVVRERQIPIVMLTSGGYQRSTAAIIADSIANLHHTGLIDLKPSTLVSAQPRSTTTTTATSTATAGGGCGITGSNLTRSMSNNKSSPKPFSTSSPSPPFKYAAFLSRCSGGKKSSAVSASESSTPVSGRYSITDSTTSSPPLSTHHQPDQPLPALKIKQEQDQQITTEPCITEEPKNKSESLSENNIDVINKQPQLLHDQSKVEEQLHIHQQQPPSFINIKPNSDIRHSIVSAGSCEYGTPRSTATPGLLTAAQSPSTPCSSNLHPSMTQQASITDSLTPPSPAYRSVAGSINTVNTINSPHTDTSSTPPPHHKSIDSTLSLAQHSSIATPPSHYESADSIEMPGSLQSNTNVLMPP
uniref:Histone deacetylase 11 n=1 Tax=Hirondellea gigas TaxID=1518452 RepID=A0A2P2I964_9CRUS